MYLQERPALDLMDKLKGHSQMSGYGSAKVNYVEREGFIVVVHMHSTMTEVDFAFFVDMAHRYQTNITATHHDGTLRVQFGN